MTFRPVPKNPYKPRKPTKANRGKFDEKTRKAIHERDNYSCRVCGIQASQIHHVKFKSANGRGVYTNGLTLCQGCHSDVHKHHEKAKYWQDKFSDMYGNDFYEDAWDKE